MIASRLNYALKIREQRLTESRSSIRGSGGRMGLASPAATVRLEHARRWLLDGNPSDEVLVVGATTESASDLLRNTAVDCVGGASFGWHRASINRLAAQLAEMALIESGRVPVSRFGTEAIVM